MPGTTRTECPGTTSTPTLRSHHPCWPNNLPASNSNNTRSSTNYNSRFLPNSNITFTTNFNNPFSPRTNQSTKSSFRGRKLHFSWRENKSDYGRRQHTTQQRIWTATMTPTQKRRFSPRASSRTLVSFNNIIFLNVKTPPTSTAATSSSVDSWLHPINHG